MSFRKTLANRAFTLIELLVVVAVIAVLISILAPALSGARAATRRTACASNLRQIGIGIHTYADENRGFTPRGPDPLHPYDFTSNQMATNQIWIGDGTPEFPAAQPRQYLGQGRLLKTTCPQPRVFFCPADDNFNQQHQLARIGTAQHAYGSYIYRELDHLPTGSPPGLLDRMGVNQIGDVLVRVEVLALDTNSLGSGPYHHTNHGGHRANVLFRDSSVQNFANTADSLAIPAAAFDNPALIPTAIDQLLTNADYAYVSGLPHQAPRLPDSP